MLAQKQKQFQLSSGVDLTVRNSRIETLLMPVIDDRSPTELSEVEPIMIQTQSDKSVSG